MQNVYDLAHELVRSLKETDQFKDYKDAEIRYHRAEEKMKEINHSTKMNLIKSIFLCES